MSRLIALAAHDARLQYRYGIYAAYAFVMVFYILVLTQGASFLPPWTVGLIVYSDPAAVGFFFLGALMMLERAEGVRPALATSPVSAIEYALAKFGTLTGLSLIACVILLLASGHISNAPLLLATAALTSLCYLGSGVPVALRFRTVNTYLIGSAGFLIPVIAPAGLALLDPMPAWAIVLPPAAQARLMLVATGYGTSSPLEIIAMLAIVAVAAAAAIWLAISFLRREFGK